MFALKSLNRVKYYIVGEGYPSSESFDSDADAEAEDEDEVVLVGNELKFSTHAVTDSDQKTKNGRPLATAVTKVVYPFNINFRSIG